MSYRFDHKTVLITGAARGIGADLARAFAAAGAAVLVTDILEEEGQATAAAIRAAGGRAAFQRHDVRDEGQWQAAVAVAIGEFGGLDILVNNAGIEITGLLAETAYEDFRRQFDINVGGTFLGIKHGTRAMRPQGTAGRGGSILNLASVAALMSSPAVGAYGASKSAVERLTKSAAIECGKLGWNIRVNCLYPGVIQTDMGTKLAADLVHLGFFPDPQAAIAWMDSSTPLGSLGTVDDVTAAALYLSSEAARWVTGTGIVVDGGLTIGK